MLDSSHREQSYLEHVGRVALVNLEKGSTFSIQNVNQNLFFIKDNM